MFLVTSLRAGIRNMLEGVFMAKPSRVFVGVLMERLIAAWMKPVAWFKCYINVNKE